GVNKTGTLQLPDTNWAWNVITPAQLQLTAGQHALRLVAETNAANGFLGDIDYLNLLPDTSAQVGYWKFDEIAAPPPRIPQDRAILGLWFQASSGRSVIPAQQLRWMARRVTSRWERDLR